MGDLQLRFCVDERSRVLLDCSSNGFWDWTCVVRESKVSLFPTRTEGVDLRAPGMEKPPGCSLSLFRFTITVCDSTARIEAGRKLAKNKIGRKENLPSH